MSVKLNFYKPGVTEEIKYISVTTVLEKLDGRKASFRYYLKGRLQG